MPKIADALRIFAPEEWGQVDHFMAFYNQTYSFDARDKRAASGIRNHFRKAITLIRLGEKLRPNLKIDQQQLETFGYTPAENGEEISTIIEAAILELYSTVDCTVKVLRAIYGKCRGFKDSTRKVFQSVRNIGGNFPDPIRQAIIDAAWYWQLMKLRDELVHLGTGRVYENKETCMVRYDHFGLKENEKPFSIDDIYSWLQTLLDQINGFIGAIFHYLNQTLADREIFQACGMSQGKMLWRYVSPAGKVTFNSGRCGAWVWFENPGETPCPFIPMCGAYERKAPAPNGAPPIALDSTEEHLSK
ncbi:hypothetical protein [Pseudomonas oryzihabitans]|uniref:hypothetical protein n=1 Tax=Pseudomonas oryzihabitans TaxID=47885 RepID=UPI00123A6682|nr:hypothetical protein [Pseudomonas oryzihabitans]QEU05015.1 hypothetical protein FOB65_17450 [Pseudomonas oryzihabitans]